jgi:O-6-methylguanine DNA methyltransferase
MRMSPPSRKSPQLTALTIATQAGNFTARYSNSGLAVLAFPSAGKKPTAPTRSAPAGIRLWHQMTSQAVRTALTGRAPACLPPLDLAAGTVFQQRVWNALRQIDVGETRSYAQLARAAAKPRAARAVGRACGANPIPLLVPCHRVLAANGRLGGFSAGLRWKRLLLKREGTSFR